MPPSPIILTDRPSGQRGVRGGLDARGSGVVPLVTDGPAVSVVMGVDLRVGDIDGVGGRIRPAPDAGWTSVEPRDHLEAVEPFGGELRVARGVALQEGFGGELEPGAVDDGLDADVGGLAVDATDDDVQPRGVLLVV